MTAFHNVLADRSRPQPQFICRAKAQKGGPVNRLSSPHELTRRIKRKQNPEFA